MRENNKFLKIPCTLPLVQHFSPQPSAMPAAILSPLQTVQSHCRCQQQKITQMNSTFVHTLFFSHSHSLIAILLFHFSQPQSQPNQLHYNCRLHFISFLFNRQQLQPNLSAQKLHVQAEFVTLINDCVILGPQPPNSFQNST